MFVPFEELSDNAKIWVYQTNRELSEQEVKLIDLGMTDFCNHWQAHGTPLKTSFQIPFDHFLVLGVDENVASASGCSIDGSVRLIKEIGAKLNIEFFDRTLAAFLVEEKVKVYPISQLKDLFTSGTLNPTINTFDNLVPTKEVYNQKWMIPIGQSWLARYLPKSALA